MYCCSIVTGCVPIFNHRAFHCWAWISEPIQAWFRPYAWGHCPSSSCGLEKVFLRGSFCIWSFPFSPAIAATTTRFDCDVTLGVTFNVGFPPHKKLFAKFNLGLIRFQESSSTCLPFLPHGSVFPFWLFFWLTASSSGFARFASGLRVFPSSCLGSLLIS